MKMKNAMTILVVTACLLFVAQPAFPLGGVKEVSGGVTFLDTLVDPAAGGKIVEGSITLLNLGLGLEAPCPTSEGDVLITMFFTVRIEDVVLPFIGTAQGCYFDVEGQATIIGDFITSSVIPAVFPRLVDPTWKIKEIKNVLVPTEGDPIVMVGDYLVADFKLAVEGKHKHRGRK